MLILDPFRCSRMSDAASFVLISLFLEVQAETFEVDQVFSFLSNWAQFIVRGAKSTLVKEIQIIKHAVVTHDWLLRVVVAQGFVHLFTW